MIRESRTAPPRWLLVATVLAASIQPVAAASLRDALDGALARAQVEPTAETASASSWLAGIPSITASYIDSQEALGTDEAEVQLNLPIKSRSRRRLDDRLSQATEQLESASRAYLRWRYSGYVRERAWDARLAQVRLEAVQQKLAALKSLAQRTSELAGAGTLPAYASLIIEREELDARLALSEREADLERSLADFQSLTGLQAPPDDLTEDSDIPSQLSYADHPAMRRLEHARAQESTLLALSAPDSASWNIALVARNFEGPTLEEEQYGMQIQMPLNFMGTRSTASNSQLRSTQRDYLIARDELWLSLRQRWDATQLEARQLEHRQTLLLDAVAVGERIESHILALRARNEIEDEVLLRRLLDVIDTRAELALTRELLERNRAQLRQAAGWSL